MLVILTNPMISTPFWLDAIVEPISTKFFFIVSIKFSLSNLESCLFVLELSQKLGRKSPFHRLLYFYLILLRTNVAQDGVKLTM